ncbi:HNH endonuclease signature motif containing protein, partial [Prauserella rugosa]|uniref:HNH endonuclease signature motif containing protein n=1 Tax=Prauserella rugosa TaxID=43354 RepID=UPI001B80A454
AHSRLTAELPSEVASACYARVDAMARRLRRDGELRTLDQLRADITADLLLGNDPGAKVPEAAANSVWRKVVCDPATGQPLDLGRSRRRPNAAIRELVRVRDRECVVPWCRRPARHCDLDHQREWSAENGPTSAANTAPRCRRHHRMKNAPGWITRYDPLHGTSSITTPHGSTYTGRRRPVLIPKPSDTSEADEPPPF